MKTSYLLPIVAVAAVFAALSLRPALQAQQSSSATMAHGTGEVHEPVRWMLARRCLGCLNVNDEQKKAGLAVLRNHQPAIKPLVENLVRERNALRALSKAPAVDESAIRTQSARVAGIEADLAVQKAYLLHDLRAVATPDQLRTLDEMQTQGETRRDEVIQRVNNWIADS